MLGAQIEKTTNHEACRDLSGRRMRDVNNEKKWVILHTHPCITHVMLTWCAYDTYVICMCYPCDIHEACRDLSGRRMRDVNNEKKWVYCTHPCITHVMLTWCAYDTYVICMCYPCDIHEACRDLSGRRMRDVNNEKKWVILHTPMYYTCDAHMVCIWYLCNLHVLPMWHPWGMQRSEWQKNEGCQQWKEVSYFTHTPMCCTCDTHVVCMWYLCYPCDIHEACRDLSGRRMRDVNNEKKWVILHTHPCVAHVIPTWCACDTYVTHVTSMRHAEIWVAEEWEMSTMKRSELFYTHTHVLHMWYPHGVHVIPMLPMWHPWGMQRSEWQKNERCQQWKEVSYFTHTPMCCTCDTHVVCMWYLCYPCDIHEACRGLSGRRMRDVNNEKKWVILHTPMWCICDTHMVCMWYLCYPCDIHGACRDLSGRRMRDVNNEKKWVICNTYTRRMQ